MKRLHDDVAWPRIGLQLGLLTGIGLAFVAGSQQRPAKAGGPGCVAENQCSFKRPNVMFIVDYSTLMNTPWALNLTRWEGVVAPLGEVAGPGTFLSQNAHLALMRFGHDPLPGAAGTTIPNDASGLVDGQALDVAWDNANAQYLDCAGELVVNSLEATPPPLDGALDGIGSWTKGALDRAATEINQTKADHPQDREGPSERAYLNVVLTDGVWTGIDGTTPQAPANQDPGLLRRRCSTTSTFAPTWSRSTVMPRPKSRPTSSRLRAAPRRRSTQGHPQCSSRRSRASPTRSAAQPSRPSVPASSRA